MNIQIKAINTTLTDAIRNNIKDKLSVLEPFLKEEDKVSAELEEGNKHHTGRFSKVGVHISPHGYYAEAQGNDFYEAMDLVIPKIREQLKRKKDKRVSLRRRLGNIFKRNRPTDGDIE